MHGAYTFLTSSSEEKLTRAKTLGADALINYRSQPEWDQEILKETGGAGVDLVIEVGGAGTLERSMNVVRPGGIICVIGALAGAGAVNPRMINRKAIRLLGIHVGSRDMFDAMNRAVALHRLKPAIDKIFGFSDAKAAYLHQQSGKHFGKIVISIAP
jgi:NADPH:quinone reductase-like Zn-dependent oxidoreductase